MTWSIESPEGIVTEVFDAFFDRKPARVVELSDPDSLESYAQRAARSSTPDLSQFPVGHSPEALRLLPADQLLGLAVKNAPPPLKGARVAAIGHVRESDNLAYVLFRILYTIEGRTIAFPDEPQVATLRLVKNAWRLVLDPWSLAGMPGFRDFGWWVDDVNASSAP